MTETPTMPVVEAASMSAYDAAVISAAQRMQAEGLTAEDMEQANEDVIATDPTAIAHDEDGRQLHRYLRRRGQVAAELTHVKDQTAALIKSIETKLKALDFLFGAFAENYARRTITGKTKSIKTPFGTIGFRSQAALVVVLDEAAALAAIPDTCKRVKVEIAKAELNKHVEQTGEIPDGCEVRPACEKFYVR